MRSRLFALALAAALLCALCAGCAKSPATETPQEDKLEKIRNANRIDTTGFLRLVDDSMDTVDPQCTTEYYTVALNVFDRLVELQSNDDGYAKIVPSLADSWEVSSDGLVYRFHLHEGVKFSDGNDLTASDVRFTFERLLTHPNAANRDLVMCVLGAEELHSGKADTLKGFRELDDLTFEVTLAYPYEPFISTLSSPGASILDEDSVKHADLLFGVYPQFTVGTGPFILKRWTIGTEMLLVANEDCWSGAPKCPGIQITLMRDAEAQRLMFEEGTLDILDLDNLGGEAEMFLHSEQFKQNIQSGLRVGLKYIALNESFPPLDDVRVRKALQIALDRRVILDAVYGGYGQLENGIFPYGLTGHNDDLPEIPYDPEEASRLLEEAGYGDGFDLEILISEDAAETNREVVELAAYMWQQIGVRPQVNVVTEQEFSAKRKSGQAMCYTHGWTADYDDPDNFIYTFFGNAENSKYRSICYSDEATMERVRNARAILNDLARIKEYRELEKKIIQEDAAWIPLCSHEHFFVISDRVEGFKVPWNGWSMGMYRDVRVKD